MYKHTRIYTKYKNFSVDHKPDVHPRKY